MSNVVLERLETARRELLDLGLRNPLLNFREFRTTLEVVDEITEEIYRLLVLENRLLSLEPLPETVQRQLENEEGDASLSIDWTEIFESDQEINGGNLERHKDTKLQTRYTAESLLRRILPIQYKAKSAIEEQGVNILYLACGFLEWYEAEQATLSRRAPLLLIPVELKRTSTRSKFRVTYTGEDLTENLSLVEKLKVDFGLKMPEFPREESSLIQPYFDEVAKKVGPMNRWSVHPNSMFLGFFSFNKLLMYRDLDTKAWSKEQSPENHPIITSLLETSFPAVEDPLEELEDVDAILHPKDCYHVMDADSTQIQALLSVRSGRNLIIQGPPGTGKSQTITNILAQALADGKKVLFVSEKLAALNVVKRRLDLAGLGDAGLELHSNKTRKRDVVQELDRTLNVLQPKSIDNSDEIERLRDLRDSLNAYCSAANAPIEPSRLSPVEVIGLYSSLGEDVFSLPHFDSTCFREWNDLEFAEVRQSVVELQATLGEIGVPSRNAFWGSQLLSVLPREEAELKALLADALETTEEIRVKSTRLAEELMLSAPATTDDVGIICRAARRALEAPQNLDKLQLRSGAWQDRRDDISDLLEQGQKLKDLHGRWDQLILDDAWEQDVLTDRTILASTGTRWWRLLSGSYRKSRDRIAGLYKEDLPKDPRRRLEIVDAILAVRGARRQFDQLEPLGRKLFLAQWEHTGSDWPVLKRLAEWVIALHDSIGDGELPSGLIEFFSGSKGLVALAPYVDEIDSLLVHQIGLIRSVAEKLKCDRRDEQDCVAGLAQAPIDRQLQILRRCTAKPSELRNAIRFNLHKKQLEERGLGSITRACSTWARAELDLVRAFDAARYEALLAHSMNTRQSLRDFNLSQHEKRVSAFRDLDRKLINQNRQRLSSSHFANLPRIEGAGGELSVLRKEINRKRGHLPIRQLMSRAWRAIQAIKPIFMMSPLSVAAYLPPNSVQFDLVVFDEASQVKPVDALGAILRGRQAAVVGDRKQLPPTSFFDKIVELDSEIEAPTADMESILGLFDTQGCPSRMLSWHYRSRHDSLIAVSNYEFYDNRLTVFPGPGESLDARGLVFKHLPDTVYDRGGTSRNLEEAAAVAQEVVQHVREHPELTLGVATFSMAQREAIELQLEVLKRKDEEIEDFFNSHPEEPFFIKNLESVQGDERDVIIISIGFGRDRYGKISMNFGPLNNDGGERRLNVLISRARRTCLVFSNIRGDDIDISKSSARGVRALKTFLAYAESRRLDIPAPTGGEAESVFERQVALALADAGYTVDAQIGTAGFRIDLGVRDPETPGRYILGIECDGATYHSARSARDRDRLRHEILEGLGWKLHRIWSTDWFTDRHQALKRAVEAIEYAKSLPSCQKPQMHLSSPTSIQRLPKTRKPAEHDASTPYKVTNVFFGLGGLAFHEVSRQYLAERLVDIVGEEGPIHREVATQRLTRAAGLRRAGARIQETIEQCIVLGTREGLFEIRNDFIWLPEQEISLVRDRSELEQNEKKLHLIPKEEIELALVQFVSASFSVDSESAVQGALRKLGMSRITSQMSLVAKDVLSSLISKGSIKNEAGRLMVQEQ